MHSSHDRSSPPMHPKEAVSHRMRLENSTITAQREPAPAQQPAVRREAAPLTQCGQLCGGKKYTAVTVLISIPHISRAPGHHSEQVHRDAWHRRKQYLHSNTQGAPGAGGAGSLTQKPCVREGKNSEKQWLDFSWVFWVAWQHTQQRFVGIILTRFVLGTDPPKLLRVPPGLSLQ